MFASLLYFIGLAALAASPHFFIDPQDEQIQREAFGFSALISGCGFLLYSFIYALVTSS